MPSLRLNEAIERLAKAVESASSEDLVDIYVELFPDKASPNVSAVNSHLGEVVSYIRTKIEPEEIVDLWNVVFPSDRNVCYDEQENLVKYNQEAPWYAER